MRSKVQFVENEASTQIVAIALLHFERHYIVNNPNLCISQCHCDEPSDDNEILFKYNIAILQLSTDTMLNKISTGQLTKENLDKLGQKR